MKMMIDDEDWGTVSTRGNPDVEQNYPRLSSELSVPYSDVTSKFRPNILVILIYVIMILKE
jgi:hypothetical protein